MGVGEGRREALCDFHSDRYLAVTSESRCGWLLPKLINSGYLLEKMDEDKIGDFPPKRLKPSLFFYFYYYYF